MHKISRAFGYASSEFWRRIEQSKKLEGSDEDMEKATLEALGRYFLDIYRGLKGRIPPEREALS